MEKTLTLNKLYWRNEDENRNKIYGSRPEMSGDCSGLEGDCSGLRGNCSELWGNLYYCKITEKERKKGIDIRDLIED